jgi:hypothetical protein
MLNSNWDTQPCESVTIPTGSSLRGGSLSHLLAASAVLLVAWSFVTPIFEAPDETHHCDYERYLHDHKRLPPISSAVVESTHPPLYYLLIAPFAWDEGGPPPRMCCAVDIQERGDVLAAFSGVGQLPGVVNLLPG